MDVCPGEHSCYEIAALGAKRFQQALLDFGLPLDLKALGQERTMEEFRPQIEKLAKRGVISKEELEAIVQASIECPPGWDEPNVDLFKIPQEHALFPNTTE